MLLWLVAGYLLGSFPSAYLGSRLFGRKDIRRVGSGNVGGMNALRNVSLAAGVFTMVADVGKGALAVWLAVLYGPGALAALATLVGVVAGHNWMLFLGFKGGKGLGATIGGLLILEPALVLVFASFMAIWALLTHDSNVGAGLAALTLPVGFWWAGSGDPVWIVAGVVLGLIIAVKHWPDFKAYVAGRRQLV